MYSKSLQCTTSSARVGESTKGHHKSVIHFNNNIWGNGNWKSKLILVKEYLIKVGDWQPLQYW